MKLLAAALLFALPLAQDKVELRWKWLELSNRKFSIRLTIRVSERRLGSL